MSVRTLLTAAVAATAFLTTAFAPPPADRPRPTSSGALPPACTVEVPASTWPGKVFDLPDLRGGGGASPVKWT